MIFSLIQGIAHHVGNIKTGFHFSIDEEKFSIFFQGRQHGVSSCIQIANMLNNLFELVVIYSLCFLVGVEIVQRFFILNILLKRV